MGYLAILDYLCSADDIVYLRKKLWRKHWDWYISVRWSNRRFKKASLQNAWARLLWSCNRWLLLWP